MASLNRVILIGHLGQAPESRYLPNGDQVANLSLATTEQWKDKSGEKHERTEWWRIECWGRLAEVVGKYLEKGSQIYIEGSGYTQEWEKDGVKRYTFKVRAHHLVMLGGRRDGDASAEGRPAARASTTPGATTTPDSRRPAAAPEKGHFDDMEDDIPF